MSMARTAESGEGEEVADGEEAVGAPAVVLQPDEKFLYGSPYFITKSPPMPPELDPSCIGGDRLSNRPCPIHYEPENSDVLPPIAGIGCVWGRSAHRSGLGC